MTTAPTSPVRILSAQQAAGDWDLVVIGGGTAGLVAGRTGAMLGARTLLIEANRPGGECLYTGCVPSKALIAAANAAHTARTASRFGIDVAAVSIDFARVMTHVREAIRTIEPVDSADALVAAGVHVLHGHARFIGEREVEVDGHTLRFRDAVLATGSSPVLPDAPGADGIDILTSETVWDLDDRPERLLVVGAGATACEIGQAMARLGSHVTLVDAGHRLLPKEEPRAGDVVQAALEADGVDVRLGTAVSRFDPDGRMPSAGGTVVLADGSTVGFDRVLAAVGRRVDTADLGLGAAGIALDGTGAVTVDATMRTTNRRVRAAGDVTSLPRFTHTAGMFASVATVNAVLGLSRRADTDVVPRVTFTSPEVGSVGVTADEGRARGFGVVVERHAHVDRAITDAETSGFTTLVLDKRGRLRGATVVGPRAGEVLGELTTAIKAGLTVRELATTTHAYPTYADTAWNAETRLAQEELREGVLGRGIDVLRAVRARRD